MVQKFFFGFSGSILFSIKHDELRPAWPGRAQFPTLGDAIQAEKISDRDGGDVASHPFAHAWTGTLSFSKLLLRCLTSKRLLARSQHATSPQLSLLLCRTPLSQPTARLLSLACRICSLTTSSRSSRACSADESAASMSSIGCVCLRSKSRMIRGRHRSLNFLGSCRD